MFKVLLYLYWDLECYLENTDYINNDLIMNTEVNTEGFAFLIIKFKKPIKPDIEFFEKNALRNPTHFWTDLEIVAMFDSIWNYDIFSKMCNLEKYYKNNVNIEFYKLYKRFNDYNYYGEIVALRNLQSKYEIIEPSYYESYINTWYDEWKSEFNVDLTLKYKEKINELKIEYNNLNKILQDKNK